MSSNPYMKRIAWRRCAVCRLEIRIADSCVRAVGDTDLCAPCAIERHEAAAELAAIDVQSDSI